MKISSIQTFLLAIALTLASSVHIQKHKQYKQKQYLQALENQQSKFQKGIDKLNESYRKIDQKINQTQVIDDKIRILEGAVVDQEGQIFQLSTSVIPPLDLSTCNCQSLSQNDRQKLADRADIALQRVKDLKQQLGSMKGKENDVRLIELQQNADNQIFYLGTIKKVLKSNCTTQAILAPTVYQSNIYATNWILGNQGINDLVKSYIERSKKYDSISNCAKETPYYNGKQCINCSKDNPIFNMETQKCVKCPSDTHLDAKLRACVDNRILLSNIFTTEPWVSEEGNTTQVLADLVKKVELGKDYRYCSQKTPFVVDGVCVKCRATQIYHIDKEKCVLPNNDIVYDPNIHSLVTKMKGYETNPKAANLLTLGDLPDIKEVPNCPLQTPHYDDITCIKCPEPIPLFNTATRKCVACQAAQFYNAETRSCQSRQVLYSNGNYRNLLGLPNKSVNNYLQNISKIQQQHPQAIISKCKQTQNSAVTSCIQCKDDESFNVGTLKCIKCKNFNSTEKTCYDGVYFVTNVDAANGTLIAEQGLQKYINDIKKNITNAVDTIPCPKDKPYSDGKKCFPCPKNTPLFNVSSLKCTKCPKKFIYNSSLQLCKEAPATYISSPDGAKNLVGSGKEEVQAYFDNQSKIAASVDNPVVCPKQTPYSNGKKCISCQDPTPLFDVKGKQCTKCPTGKNYVPGNFTCGECPKGTEYDGSSKKCVVRDVKFISNPGQGRYTGRSSEQVNKYISKSLKQSQTLPNIVVCPPKTPYSNGTRCISCEGKTPLFDVNSLTCVNCKNNSLYNSQTYLCQSCPKGYIVNQNGTKCVQVPTVSNITAFDRILIGDKANISNYKPTKDQLQCPQKTPFFNGQKCINCEKGQLFNIDTKKCEKCPEGKSYVIATHKCQKPQAINPKYLDKVITNGKQVPIANDSVVPCPEKTPFYDGSGCIACDEVNFLFDLKEKRCTQCPKGTIFDKNTHQCLKPTKITNFEAGGNRVAIGKNQNYEDLKKTAQSMKNIQICPSATPFFDGSKCIDCELGQVFNLSSNKCENCPQFKVFNKKTHLCEDFPQASNLDNPNWISNNAEKIIKKTKQSLNNGSAVKCPQDKPFSTGNICINCNSSTSFNADTKKCQKCAQGQVIDFENHKCVVPTKFVTNLSSATNLIYDGISKDELEKMYEQAKKKNKNIKDCPKETPYYNGASCIVCTGTKPYFNMNERYCQDCPQGTHYDRQEHDCMEDKKKDETPQIDTDPTIAKLAANVFSHRKTQHTNTLHRMTL